jgi:actin-like ATPase involved in cell morphogenesis
VAWVLGVDLGTTFTAAASWREGHAEIISLGTRSAAVPSVVLFRDDGSTMTGDAAEIRSVTEPEHVAREFKRRVGDSTPLLVGGSPRSPESIMSVLLRAVVNQAIQQEGSQPDRIAVTHPASWGQFKLDVLRQAIRLAELGADVELVPEPVAAAVHYATLQRVELNDFVAVYDLGGGTFDAAVVRRTADGFSIYGQPEGIERLGGIDVDAAVFGHVQSTLGLQLESLDREDPAVISAFARLRADCVAAKEALSSDTDAVIPVMLPGLATEVRITRNELEGMIRPALNDSIAALRRAITSGGLVPEHIARVLLVGGSSRIPLVAEMVTSALGRPIALDTHPKHAVALGAATSIAPKQPAAAPGPAFFPPPPIPPPPKPSAPTPAPVPVPPLTTPTPTTTPPGPPRPPVTTGPSGPGGPTPSKRNPAIIIAAIIGVLALGIGAFALTQSGGSKSASSDSSVPSSDFSNFSDSTDFTDSGSLTESDAQSAAEDFARTLFTFDSSTISSFKDNLLAITTGALHDEIDGESASFSTDVQSSDTSSVGNVTNSSVLSFDPSFAIVSVDISLTVSQSGSTAPDAIKLTLVVNLDNVDGTFLASAVANCSSGSGSDLSLGFTNSDAEATC